MNFPGKEKFIHIKITTDVKQILLRLKLLLILYIMMNFSQFVFQYLTILTVRLLRTVVAAPS